MVADMEQCQKRDWPEHKKDCHLWSSDPSEAARLMENAHKAGLSSYFDNMGLKYFNLG